MASIANCACLNQLVTPPTVDSSVKEGEGDAMYGIDIHVIECSELECSLGVPALNEYHLPYEQKKDTASEVTHGVASPHPISLTTGVVPDKSECLQERNFIKHFSTPRSRWVLLVNLMSISEQDMRVLACFLTCYVCRMTRLLAIFSRHRPTWDSPGRSWMPSPTRSSWAHGPFSRSTPLTCHRRGDTVQLAQLNQYPKMFY